MNTVVKIRRMSAAGRKVIMQPYFGPASHMHNHVLEEAADGRSGLEPLFYRWQRLCARTRKGGTTPAPGMNGSFWLRGGGGKKKGAREEGE
jgi:hypothetical protein